MSRSRISETLLRLLPGESNKRIREAILLAAGQGTAAAKQVSQSIDFANRLRTGLLVNGTTTILSDTSASISGYVWVIDFAVKQPTGATSLTILAPESAYARDDYFIGLEDGTIEYRAGTVDALGNSFPPTYDSSTEVVLRIVRRNPDGTNEDQDLPPSNNLIDFAEQNIIPYVKEGKLKYSGIQVLFDALGEISGFKYPTPVKGLPAVNPDEFVTKSQLPAVQQYGRISGGVIQWSGSGLIYNFSRAFLAISGECIAESGQVTLDPADPTDPRFDGLGWEKIAAGIADRIKLTGTPAASPAFPQFNPETQVEGIFVLVPAAATTPSGVTTEDVYLNNTQWAVTFAGIGTGNADSTADPHEDTKAIETSSIRNGFKITFDRGSVLDLNTLTDPTLGWWQKLKSSMGNNQNFEVIFLDGSGNPASNLVQVPLNKSNLSYQFVGLNLEAFTFSTRLIRYIELRYKQNGSGFFNGTFIDTVKIQGGVTQPNPSGGIPDAPRDGTTYGRKDGGWVAVSGGGLADAPSDGNFYGRKNAAWVGIAPEIIDGLNAASVDSPGSSNRFVTVYLLNSYGYTQEAPINGNYHARKDGVWVAFTPGIAHAASDGNYYASRNGGWTAFTPFSVAGTPTDGHVITSVSGVPTWAAPSGGGGGNFIAYDTAQSLTGSQRQQALDNIGATSGSIQTFTNSGAVTVDDLVITKSNIEFAGSSTVTLRGIVPLWVGQEVTIFNRTGNDLTIISESGGSSAANRFQQPVVIPTQTVARYKYVNFNGAFRWVLNSNPWYVPNAGGGIYYSGSVGIGQSHEASVGLTVRTVGSVALRVNDITGSSRIFEVQNSLIRSNIPHGFGNISPEAGVAMCVRPISYNICTRYYDTSNVRQVDVMGNGNWQSRGGAFFGAANTGNAPTARVDIRGVGTGAGYTLICEDSAGTDNVRFVDNGRVQMLRLPTSTTGLSAGDLWNDSGTIKIV